MADKPLKSIIFPGLTDRYVIPDIEVDNTLTQEGMAADAKAVGDEVTDLKDAISDIGIKTINDYPQNSGSFKSDGTWVNATSPNYKHIVVPILPSDEIKITAGATQAIFAIFASYTTPTNGASIPYSNVSGFTTSFNVPAGQSLTKTAPSDAAYLYIAMLSSGNSIIPSSVIINDADLTVTFNDNFKNIARTATQAMVEADASIEGLNQLKTRTSYDIFTDYPTGMGTYNSSGKWTNVSVNYMHSVIPISANDLVTIIGGIRSSWCCVLTSYSTPVVNNAIPFSSVEGFTRPILIGTSAKVSFTAPNDAVYLIVNIKVTGNDATPSVININGIDIKKTALETLKETVRGLNFVKETSDKTESDLDILKASVGFNSLAVLPENSGLLQANGTWTYVNNSNYPSWHVAFPVKSGDSIVFSGTSTSIAFLKDYNKPTADGQSVQFSDEQGYTGVKTLINISAYTYIVPSDVHFMYILTINNGTARIIGDVTINGVSVKMSLADNFKRIFEPTPTVNWCAMGDSITYGYYSIFDPGGGASSHTIGREDIGWTFLVAKKNNWNLTNIGIGGMGYLVQGSGTTMRGYTQARETDYSSYDIVTIALGINDWKKNCQMGSMEDDQTAETITAFIPAMRATLEAIMTSNPSCKIIVITPLNANGYEHNYGTVETNWGMGYPMSSSGTLKEFRDVMIEICEMYGIQYLDMSSQSCINSIALPTMLPDGVHPAIETHKLLAMELAKKITF